MSRSMPSIEIKAQILSHGLALDEHALRHYGPPFLEKRRAYGNQDPFAIRNRIIPQELYLLPERLVAAVNVRPSSPLRLLYDEGRFHVSNGTEVDVSVDFPLRPQFYDAIMTSGQRVSQIITLYGGASLAIFGFGDCDLVQRDEACQYCSIGQNRTVEKDFPRVVKPADVEESIALALSHDAVPRQVMLNGGNLPDMDDSFRYYASLASAARRAIDASGKDVPLHLIVFPPRELDLLRLLVDLDVSVAINMEVFDPLLFERLCPGKQRLGGHSHILNALEAAVKVLGDKKVFSIVVGGLDNLKDLETGLRSLADRGISPVINVFHPDPGTPLESLSTPSPEVILRMGRMLQAVYCSNEFRPFYDGCGRNSLDTEAYLRMFT
jgi:hypothetical protein